MKIRRDIQDQTHIMTCTYEAPELTFMGEAADLILGMPGGGYDGDVGMTEPPFEFETDGLD